MQLNYATICSIRALNNEQEYQTIQHRSFYLESNSEGGLWLAVCLYNYSFENYKAVNGIGGRIINTKIGDIFHVSTYVNCVNLLTSREKEILTFISEGITSKEIAFRLCISINTVNRHRQNILLKLNVSNAVEAVRTAVALRIL